MLIDPVEIDIISSARQANVRSPKDAREHFRRIFDDFLNPVQMQGTKILDLGPGHWDFGELARERCAEVWGVDNDPPVLALGPHKGFHVAAGELRWPAKLKLPVLFDGLFCKFSVNAFWAWRSEAAQQRFVPELLSLARPDAWTWISPWNGPSKKRPSKRINVLGWQKSAFEKHGCRWRELTRDEAIYYGVHGDTENWIVFARGL